jgi:2'-5' RNA ligase
MRLFVAIPLAQAVEREIKALAARLRRSGDGLRWTAPESWHITLQFLGNATTEQFACLRERLAEVRFAPFTVRLGELGSFPRAGVLFVEVVTSAELEALAQSVVSATGHCGFTAEDRPFHPHITLARETGNKGPRERGNNSRGGSFAGRRVDLRQLREQTRGLDAFQPFTAREFLLYESYLEPAGARYEVKARFATAGMRESPPDRPLSA